ncbi:acyl-CoA thioesterase [Bradyrhizobium roseum]|uniref:acyl-CoA thioesterase n=1 Tax=Bradyrhizobium roseum TaxID=3056648 RepID=UPI002626DAB6|nr:thioesterase family protein [Bradyrhizobium roseus]WKA28049.1 thioesterase family protein [Bradyrhizobium roseus]
MRTDATYRGTVYPWQCDHVGHMTIAYKRELLAGDIVEVRSRRLEIRDRSIRFVHEMRNGETSETAATCEFVGVHMDRQTRKSVPFAPAIRSAAEKQLDPAMA